MEMACRRCQLGCYSLGALDELASLCVGAEESRMASRKPELDEWNNSCTEGETDREEKIGKLWLVQRNRRPRRTDNSRELPYRPAALPTNPGLAVN